MEERWGIFSVSLLFYHEKCYTMRLLSFCLHYMLCCAAARASSLGSFRRVRTTQHITTWKCSSVISILILGCALEKQKSRRRRQQIKRERENRMNMCKQHRESHRESEAMNHENEKSKEHRSRYKLYLISENVYLESPAERGESSLLRLRHTQFFFFFVEILN